MGTGVPVGTVEGVTAGEVGTSLLSGVAEALLGARSFGGGLAKGKVPLSDAAAEGLFGVWSAGALWGQVAEALLGGERSLQMGAGSPVRVGLLDPFWGEEKSQQRVGVPLGDGVAGSLFWRRRSHSWGSKSPFGGGLTGALLGDRRWAPFGGRGRSHRLGWSLSRWASWGSFGRWVAGLLWGREGHRWEWSLPLEVG